MIHDKVLDRVLFRLDDLVRPYVHKVLTVITPLLIDQDYYARIEGREIIANLAKAAGLASVISAMRPDLENTDEYVMIMIMMMMMMTTTTMITRKTRSMDIDPYIHTYNNTHHIHHDIMIYHDHDISPDDPTNPHSHPHPHPHPHKPHPHPHHRRYVRNITARALAVVTSALGVPTTLPFLRAVCRATKSWQARHTGVKIVQQVAILLGCAVLPQLTPLVESIAHGLTDDNQKVSIYLCVHIYTYMYTCIHVYDVPCTQSSPSVITHPPSPIPSPPYLSIYCSIYLSIVRSIYLSIVRSIYLTLTLTLTFRSYI